MSNTPTPEKQDHRAQFNAFLIEKGIAPPSRQSQGRIYPFKQMQPGDSFFVAGVEAGRRAATSCRTQRHKGKLSGEWAARSVMENGIAGMRIWRIS